MPRYWVPEDIEITNEQKKNYNGCNGLAGSERALKWDRVASLQCYGHLLEQVGGLSLVACDVCRPWRTSIIIIFNPRYLCSRGSFKIGNTKWK